MVQIWLRKNGVHLSLNRTELQPFSERGSFSKSFRNPFRGQLAGLILPVDQADDDLDHRVHLVGVALGNHQGQCDKGGIGDALRSVRPVKDSIVLHEPEEERGCDSFVAVNEGVVLDDKI